MISYTYLILFTLGLLVIWVPWLLAHKIRPYFGKKNLSEWLDKHQHQKRVKLALATVEEAYKTTNTFKVSKAARTNRKLESDQFMYGEILDLTLVKMLEVAQPKAGEVFYDLGSGGGRTVFMADLCYDFKRCCGIEILEPLYRLSLNKRKQINEIAKAKDKSYHSTVDFINGDFLTLDFNDADIIFINATAWGGYIWENLVAKLKKLKVGCRIIVTTFKLNYPEFKCLLETHEVMSWGFCSVRIYQRIEG